MATRSFRLLHTGQRDQIASVATDTSGGTIILNGAIEVLLDDTRFKDKGQVLALLDSIRATILGTAFPLTGTT